MFFYYNSAGQDIAIVVFDQYNLLHQHDYSWKNKSNASVFIPYYDNWINNNRIDLGFLNGPPQYMQ